MSYLHQNSVVGARTNIGHVFLRLRGGDMPSPVASCPSASGPIGTRAALRGGFFARMVSRAENPRCGLRKLNPVMGAARPTGC